MPSYVVHRSRKTIQEVCASFLVSESPNTLLTFYLTTNYQVHLFCLCMHLLKNVDTEASKPIVS